MCITGSDRYKSFQSWSRRKDREEREYHHQYISSFQYNFCNGLVVDIAVAVVAMTATTDYTKAVVEADLIIATIHLIAEEVIVINVLVLLPVSFLFKILILLKNNYARLFD